MNISAITVDPSIQPRVSLNLGKIKQFTKILENGGELAPITLFFDGQTYWLTDGFHRHQAYSMMKRTDIPAEVRQGTIRDAIIYSIQINAAHGLGLSLSERKQAACRLLLDSEWRKWNDSQISRICRLDRKTFAKIKLHIYQNGENPLQEDNSQSLVKILPEMLQGVSWGNPQDTPSLKVSDRPNIRRITRNGIDFDMDVSNIGNNRISKDDRCDLPSNVIDITHTTQTVFEVLPASNDKDPKTFCIHQAHFDEPLISDNQYEFNFKLLTSGPSHALPCIIDMMCNFPSFAQFVYGQALKLSDQSSDTAS